MKTMRFGFAAILAASLWVPAVVFAANPKTLSGAIVSIAGSGIIFTNGTAASYRADLNNAVLSRKNGASMNVAEMLVGDKIQVTGTLWSDNSISVQALRNLSLYAHNGTFSGKIIGINPAALSFTLQSASYGNQTIKTNNFTTFSKNKSSATFKDMELGMSATIKGVWDRSSSDVTASQVQGTLRLINIDFTGTLYGINGNSITVIGNGNVIYGVDISKAKLLDKNGKTLKLEKFVIGNTLLVKGEHVSGSVKINAFSVKDTRPAK